MSYVFKVDREETPAPGVVQMWGVAVRMPGRESVPFYVTVSPVSVHLSTEDGPRGRRLIAYFARVLKMQPTLKYRDRRGDYRDLTAEWMPTADEEDLVERLMQHLRLGFEAEEVR